MPYTCNKNLKINKSINFGCLFTLLPARQPVVGLEMTRGYFLLFGAICITHESIFAKFGAHKLYRKYVRVGKLWAWLIRAQQVRICNVRRLIHSIMDAVYYIHNVHPPSSRSRCRARSVSMTRPVGATVAIQWPISRWSHPIIRWSDHSDPNPVLIVYTVDIEDHEIIDHPYIPAGVVLDCDDAMTPTLLLFLRDKYRPLPR